MKHQTVFGLALLLIVGCGGGAGTQETESITSPSNNTVPTGAATSDTVTYKASLSTSWSRETFATRYPTSRHFSPIVGMTHNEQVELWISAGLASAGIEDMAELGATRALNAEIDGYIEQAFAQFRFNGPGISVLEDSSDVTFEVSANFPFVSLVSMVAPSPDWFVGVKNLNLIDANNQWRERIEIALPVYDAGTDSGETFTSEDSNTDPQDPILLLSTDASDSDFMQGFHRDTCGSVATLILTME